LPAEPEFVAARSVDEAVEHLAADEEAVAVSGGTSIGLLTGQGLINPPKLVWLGRIPGLDAVTASEHAVTIGAGVTLLDLARHPLLRQGAPALAKAAGVVGNPRVRAVATVGGALAHGDPRQDVPPALLALGATVTLVGPHGQRHVQLGAFYTGFMETVLQPGDVITAVTVPLVEGRRSDYLRFTPGSAADYPTVGAAVAVTWDASGQPAGAAIALAGVAPTPLLVPAPDGRLDLEAAALAAAGAARPTDDRLGSASYKRAMAAVWTRRALEACGLGSPAT
jgi:carbon-monoxide dehydrogenase medium subunit